jgi:SagB-type dehydrogenase family enzyme
MRLTPLFPSPFGDLHEVSREFDGIAELYHENTKILRTYPPELLAGSPFEEVSQPGIDQIQLMQKAFKVYETLPQLALPKLEDLPPLPANFQELVLQRRTARNFKPIDPSLEQLAQLLNLTYGITAKSFSFKTRSFQPMRACPSGGALYPLELYVVPLRPLSHLGLGLYHFNVKDNSLEQISRENIYQPLYDVTMANQPANLQHILGEGSLAVIFTAMFSRTLGKYGNRGYRYVLLEAGHAMQNLLLASLACGYKAFESAAFDDDLLSDLLGIHGVEEAPLYYAVIGG